RTPKSAMLDISIDPMDFGPNPSKYHMKYLFGPPGELKLRRVAKDVIRDFVPLLNRVTTIADMVPVVERLKAYHARRFGFYNYVQHPIAAAFIYAKLGQEDLAREELAKWSPLDNLLIADRKRLDRLFEDALQEGRT
ncbi:MAG: hypothetical protein KDB32_09460, partial [Planctomycetes bacterium]|nr:hypothetical protein [Planctomycetota bacterium]